MSWRMGMGLSDFMAVKVINTVKDVVGVGVLV